ncbi:hypothetical protein QU487_13160 [Crenobacter sp. SG2305]|uniref:hypothetical protein n=1 Tax=Crenobacter oryzisoli TaxID=3056844 RepID=UPI0025AAFAC0|nr:hypothetical protein [Crenobacter sp. SG2305]MDN0083695.1 hypothetical protein [Crenobacter sp. SG2305]
MSWLLLVIIPIVMVYMFSSEKTLSRPIWLLFLGIVVCLWATSLTSVLAFLSKVSSLKSPGEIKVALNVCTLSLGALGGGLICTAYFQRARLLHFSGIKSLENEKLWLLEEISDIKKWVAENESKTRLRKKYLILKWM